MTNLRIFVDTTQIGAGTDAHVGTYCVFLEGPAATSASKVIGFDTATGIFILAVPVLALGLTGNAYRLHNKNELWQALTPQASADGSVHYRQIAIRNDTGTTLNDHNLYIRRLDNANIGFRSAIYDDNAGSAFAAIATEDIVPDITGDVHVGTPIQQRETVDSPYIESLGFTGQFILQPPALSSGGSRNTNNGARKQMWLSRHSPSILPFRGEVAVQFLHVFDEPGGDPDPFVVSWVAFFDVGGFTPDIAFGRDRQLRQNGGVRYEVAVRTLESGVVVPGLDVNYALTAGPGVLNPRSQDDRITDALGRSFVGYEAPAADGNVGDTVTVEAEVESA